MSMDKIANLQLETTAQYQSLSKLNVQFWNQDRETAILQFQITRNNYPLALSEENVKVFIALESGDSFLVDDKLEIVDQLNGVVSYTMPDDFMKVAQDVTGQMYVTTLDGEQTIVQRQFTFNVANDLIADLPAEDKIREIKYFSDMRVEVSTLLQKLNNDYEHLDDHVTQVRETTQAGIAALTKLIDDKEKAYNANHEAKMKKLNDKGSEYSAKFDDDKQYMDEKFEAFKSSVNGSGLVTTGQSKDWQKYKLTNDDGTTFIYEGFDFNDKESALTKKAGFYYVKNALNYTTNNIPSPLGYLQVVKTYTTGTAAMLIYTPMGSNYIGNSDIYICKKSGDWGNWNKISPSNLETTQGSQAKATTAENNAKQYTDTKFAKRSSVLFEGNANGVGTPINLSETLDNFIVLYIFGDFPGGEFAALGNPQGNRNINLNLDNIVGLDATTTSSYECTLSKVNRQQLKINSDNFMNVIDGTSSGANANKCTIQKIVGVYK